MATDTGLGWFGDLIAQHVYVDGVPMPQRRRCNFVGSQWNITDDTVNKRLNIAFSLTFDEPVTLLPTSEELSLADEGAIIAATSTGFHVMTAAAHYAFDTMTIDSTADIPRITTDDGVLPSPVPRLAIDGGEKLYLMADDEVRFGTANASYGNVAHDGSSGLVLHSDNDLRVNASGVATLRGGSAIALEPNGSGGGGAELTISGGTVFEWFAPALDLRLTTSADKDVILNSGRDVYIDVGAAADALRILEAGVEAITIVPRAAGNTTISVPDAATLVLDASDILIGGKTGYAAITLADEGVITFKSGSIGGTSLANYHFVFGTMDGTKANAMLWLDDIGTNVVDDQLFGSGTGRDYIYRRTAYNTIGHREQLISTNPSKGKEVGGVNGGCGVVLSCAQNTNYVYLQATAALINCVEINGAGDLILRSATGRTHSVRPGAGNVLDVDWQTASSAGLEQNRHATTTRNNDTLANFDLVAAASITDNRTIYATVVVHQNSPGANAVVRYEAAFQKESGTLTWLSGSAQLVANSGAIAVALTGLASPAATRFECYTHLSYGMD